MKLVSLTRIRIDGDVIEEFVRHTLRYVDELLIVDNVSPDRSDGVLRALQNEGLPLTVLRDDYIEARMDDITIYARHAFERFDPDFLLPLDADEFIRAESRDALEAAFTRLPDGAHGLVPWMTYVPVPNEDRSEPRVLARIRYRLKTEPWQFFKLMAARSFAQTSGAAFIPGNHDIKLPDGTSMPAATLDGTALAHFPVRSVPQIQSKALLGWSAFIAAGYDLVAGHDAEDGMAAQWRKLYAELRKGTTWSNELFYRAAATYFGDRVEMPELLYDPLPPVERRCTPDAPSVLDVAIEFTHQLARSHAQLQHENARLQSELAAELQSRGRRDSNPQPTSS